MYNEFGVVVGLVHIYVPFMVLTLVGVIGRIDERLEEAARGLGAGRLRAFVEVTLPLSLPGILAGSLLVFALRSAPTSRPAARRQQRADASDADLPAGERQLQPRVSPARSALCCCWSRLALVFAYNTILGRLTGKDRSHEQAPSTPGMPPT
jgi:putative spermidine/putrescine transport system permease protein